MFFLRHTHAIARWALLCFVLSLGVAIAAPLVNHQSLELVCSSVGSVKLLPSAEVQLRVAPAQPLAYALRSIPAARLAWLTAAPLPARGPPTFL